jgi:hypothetical protein
MTEMDSFTVRYGLTVYKVTMLSSIRGRFMAQAVSRRPLNADAWICFEEFASRI